MTEEALRQALEEAHGSYLILPDGVKIEPSMDSLAQAVEAMTLDDMTGGVLRVLDDRGRLLLAARNRIAAAVRSKRCVPVVDDQGNVVGWRFRED
jgi:CBS domain-containing protein